MTYTQKAIEIAVENGYPESNTKEHPKGKILRMEWVYPRLFLDSSWWQALCAEKRGNILAINPIKTARIMHRFTDHLIANKDPESFFQSILKP